MFDQSYKNGNDTGTTLDEKVDFWVPVLPCASTLALRKPANENKGGSMAMAVLNAQYKHLMSSYSQSSKTLIDSMFK